MRPRSCSSSRNRRPDTFNGEAGQLQPDLHHHGHAQDSPDATSVRPAVVRPGHLGRADQQTRGRSQQQQLHLPALPARHHALRQKLRLHPGLVAGGLPEVGDHRPEPADRPGGAGAGLEVLPAVRPRQARQPGAAQRPARQRPDQRVRPAAALRRAAVGHRALGHGVRPATSRTASRSRCGHQPGGQGLRRRRRQAGRLQLDEATDRVGRRRDGAGQYDWTRARLDRQRPPRPPG